MDPRDPPAQPHPQRRSEGIRRRVARNGNTFVAEKPRVWITTLGSAADRQSWDLAADGKRVAVVIPEGSAQALQAEHVIVMLQNFADELRRRVPLGK